MKRLKAKRTNLSLFQHVADTVNVKNMISMSFIPSFEFFATAERNIKIFAGKQTHHKSFAFYAGSRGFFRLRILKINAVAMISTKKFHDANDVHFNSILTNERFEKDFRSQSSCCRLFIKL